MRVRPHFFLLFAAVTACGEDVTQPASDEAGIIEVGSNSSLPGCDAIGFSGFNAHYECDAVVRVSTPAGWEDEMEQAIDAWAPALEPMGITFVFAGAGSQTLDLTVNDNRSGSGTTAYCGSGSEGGITLEIWYVGQQFAPSWCKNPDPVDVLIHEMNHALGFGTWVKKPWTTHCIAHRDGDIYNTAPCLYERERMLAAYELRGSFHLNKALVTGFTLSTTNVDLDPADQTSVSTSRQCEPLNIQSSYCPSWITYSWTSDDPGIATVTPSSNTHSATITAVSPGTTEITVQLAGPDSVIASGIGGVIPFLLQPRTILVTVDPLRLTSVDISPHFTMLSDDRTFPLQDTVVAVAYDQYGNPMQGVTFSWSIDDINVADFSGNPGAPPANGPMRIVRFVATGNTPIRVTASSAGGDYAIDVASIQVNCHLDNVCVE